MTDWKPIVAELERHTGEWAVVGEKSTRNAASATAHNLRLRYGLETRVRTADGMFHVYARCNENGQADD